MKEKRERERERIAWIESFSIFRSIDTYSRIGMTDKCFRYVSEADKQAVCGRRGKRGREVLNLRENGAIRLEDAGVGKAQPARRCEIRGGGD